MSSTAPTFLRYSTAILIGMILSGAANAQRAHSSAPATSSAPASASHAASSGADRGASVGPAPSRGFAESGAERAAPIRSQPAAIEAAARESHAHATASEAGFHGPSPSGFRGPSDTGFHGPSDTGFRASSDTGFRGDTGFRSTSESGFRGPSDTGFRGAPAPADNGERSSSAWRRAPRSSESIGASPTPSRPYDSARSLSESSTGRSAANVFDHVPQGSRTIDANDTPYDRSRALRAIGSLDERRSAGESSSNADRVYRSDADIDLSGWPPPRSRVPTISSSASADGSRGGSRGAGPAATRSHSDELRVTRPSAIDPWPVAGERIESSLQSRTEPITRDWISQRYRRAGASDSRHGDGAAIDALRAERGVSQKNGGRNGVPPSKARGAELSKARGVVDSSAADRSSVSDTSRASASHARSSNHENAPSSTSTLRSGHAAIAELSHLNAAHPARARALLRHGETVAHATSVGVQVGLSAGCCLISPSSCCWWWGAGAHGWQNCHNVCCASWWWWGCSSLWWPCWGPSWGFAYWHNTCGFWGYGSPYYGDPYAYYYSAPPVYYSTIIYEDRAPDAASDTTASAEYPEDPASEPTRDATPAEANDEAYSESASAAVNTQRSATRPVAATPRAATEYLGVGDRAFQDGRFSDAVYAYGRAAELAPEDALIHLVLSDALFATGDYHYCAFALRKALELDPSLVDTVVDKHSFYGDPSEFDRELALLERYVQEHFVDDDARLVLAANDLFANRPAQAADLLESAFSAAVRESPAGKILLKKAQALRRGDSSQR
jgi:hypothetical protein